MSEYQYYEFQAIDRRLTAEALDQLRACSTRARITPSSFTNDYAYGSFKGNIDAWMDEYFDAFLHIANWGTHVLKLRLPSRLLDPATARIYCGSDSASVREKADNTILSFNSNDEACGGWVEGEGILASLIGVRAELGRGDLRALYLAWLLRMQAGELADEAIEPPVPPGLGKLSASLQNLAKFLRLDNDLLHAAAEVSSPFVEVEVNHEEVREWVNKLGTVEKDELITNLVVDSDPYHIAKLVQRYCKEHTAADDRPAVPRRTVRRLLEAAEDQATERSRIEAEERAKENARGERKAAIAREKQLDSLVGQERKLWTRVQDLVATKHSSKYDQAVKILIDLRDLAARRGHSGDFGSRIEALRSAEARKPTFIARLREAGL